MDAEDEDYYNFYLLEGTVYPAMFCVWDGTTEVPVVLQVLLYLVPRFIYHGGKITNLQRI